MKDTPKCDSVRRMSEANKHKQLNGLQALRAFAFLGIFCGHFGVGLGFFSGWEVSAFIIMSGFLLVINNFDRNVPCSISQNIKYAIGKVKKLYPLHILMLLAMLALYLFIVIFRNGQGFGTPLELISYFVLDSLLIQSFVPVKDIFISLNGVAWYLSTCTFLYFLFPFMLKIMKKNYGKKKSVLFSFGTLLLMLLVPAIVRLLGASEEYYNYATYISPFYRMLDFFIGCNLGYLYLNCKKNDSAIFSTVLEAIAIGTVPLTSFLFGKYVGHFENGLFVVTALWCLPCTVLCVWVFAKRAGFITKILSAKPLVFIGDLSGPAFLIHYVVYSYLGPVFSLLGKAKGTPAFCFIGLILSLVLSFLYNLIIKKINFSRK